MGNIVDVLDRATDKIAKSMLRELEMLKDKEENFSTVFPCLSEFKELLEILFEDGYRDS
jgi:hypothetical protein